MQFDNLTPFSALVYDVDLDDGEWHVIVARGAYTLGAAPGSEEEPEVRITPLAAPSPEEEGLTVTDEYFGEMNRSSVKHESDLAPAKPKCDVIVIGSAHSPTGEPVASVEVGVRI